MISVIVPIYNTEKYLKECVDSLIRQKVDNLEIILVDDGSSDNSPIICDEYAAKHDNIRVIHKENGGLVSARKIGLSLAKHEYVTFVDSDDWIAENYFEQVVPILDTYKPDIFMTAGLFVVENDLITRVNVEKHRGFFDRKSLEDKVFKEVLYSPPYYNFGVAPSLCIKFIRRPLLEENLKKVPNIILMGEDLAGTFPCVLQANNIYFSNVYGYYYRRNQASLTHTFDIQAPERLATLLDLLRKEANCSNPKLFGLENQIAIYAVYMTEFTAVSLIKGSKNIQRDLNSLDILWRDPSVKHGLKLKLPMKTKSILFFAKIKWGFIFKIYKWLKQTRS